jgi:hypothetical protein
MRAADADPSPHKDLSITAEGADPNGRPKQARGRRHDRPMYR